MALIIHPDQIRHGDLLSVPMDVQEDVIEKARVYGWQVLAKDSEIAYDTAEVRRRDEDDAA